MNLNKELKKNVWESYLNCLTHIRKLWVCRKWEWARKRLRAEIKKAKNMKKNLKMSGSKFKQVVSY